MDEGGMFEVLDAMIRRREQMALDRALAGKPVWCVKLEFGGLGGSPTTGTYHLVTATKWPAGRSWCGTVRAGDDASWWKAEFVALPWFQNGCQRCRQLARKAGLAELIDDTKG
jgi:hypothetical protein